MKLVQVDFNEWGVNVHAWKQICNLFCIISHVEMIILDYKWLKQHWNWWLICVYNSWITPDENKIGYRSIQMIYREKNSNVFTFWFHKVSVENFQAVWVCVVQRCLMFPCLFLMNLNLVQHAGCLCASDFKKRKVCQAGELWLERCWGKRKYAVQ